MKPLKFPHEDSWAPKEYPILMSGQMVREILDGRKTETRRLKEPKVKKGQRLWVRETWRTQFGDDVRVFGYRADADPDEKGSVHGCSKWKPSIFMPRDACRILLNVTEVLHQPLHYITEKDAIAEGFGPRGGGDIAIPNPSRYRFLKYWDELNCDGCNEPEKTKGGILMSPGKPCGKCSRSDPWVWVIKFERLK
jgi:hypothetical protein